MEILPNFYNCLTDCANACECQEGKDAEVDVPLERLLYEYGPREEVDLQYVKVPGRECAKYLTLDNLTEILVKT